MVDVNVTDDRTPPASHPRHAGVEASPRQREDEGQQHQKRRLSAAVVDVRPVSGKEAEKVHPITGHPRPGESPGINIAPDLRGPGSQTLPKKKRATTLACKASSADPRLTALEPVYGV